ncbi:hypothetical protein AB0L40_12315 [Patulibacter sp. NPDC049589]|uniref:hypothetical protein n=1 Tax=Patulibacter sp. NPDC049589 TaxID=3154731 RepID=UPI00343B5399
MSAAGVALDPAAERAHRVPAEPGWSENLCFTGWDADRRIGLWLHMGRTPYDPELWHEIVALHLPDGRTLVAKNFSRSADPEAAMGDLLRLRCVEPFRSWSVAFEGPAKQVTDDVLAAGPLADGPEQLLRFALEWRSDVPVWQFGAGDWARTHYQQLGTYTGNVEIDGVVTPMRMRGWRDHSAGPRDLRPFLRHTLVAAQFDDGRSLMAVDLYDARTPDASRTARFGDGRTVAPVEALELPGMADPRRPDADYVFTTSTPDGPVEVRARMRCVIPITMFPPNHMTVGLSTAPEAYVLWMGQATFEMDGTVGSGHVERAARVGVPA